MEKANDGSDSSSDGRESIDAGPENHHKQPTRIRIENGELSVKASSHDADPDDLIETCSREMERMEKQRLVGEYQVLEEEDMFGVLLGD